MSLFIPVYKKLNYLNNVEITRPLPVDGDIVVKKDQVVVPFTKIGRIISSDTKVQIPNDLRLSKSYTNYDRIFSGEVIGKRGLGFSKFIAPFDGYISIEKDKIYLNSEPKDHWILSGLWGKIHSVVPGRAVTITTQAVDINFLVYTKKDVMGELVVFPNPSVLLDLEYLKNFSSQIKNKIVYVGHHFREELIDVALNSNVGAIIAGSVDATTFNKAQNRGLNIAITTGFGKYETPYYIFEFLKNISNRHVFINGEKGSLTIPMPPSVTMPAITKTKVLTSIKKGLEVIIFLPEYFGKTGTVVRVQNEKVYVKLRQLDQEILVTVPNIFALA